MVQLPRYDYYCAGCDVEFEQFTTIEDRNLVKHSCGESAKKRLNPVLQAHLFREAIYEHIGPEPLYISNKRDLHEACKRNEKLSTFYEGGDVREF